MEKTLETRMKKQVEKNNGWFLKFVSPGMAGVPDRLLLAPGGRIFFIEMKDIGKTLEPLQAKRKRQLEALGYEVRCVDSNEMIDSVIKEVFG